MTTTPDEIARAQQDLDWLMQRQEMRRRIRALRELGCFGESTTTLGTPERPSVIRGNEESEARPMNASDHDVDSFAMLTWRLHDGQFFNDIYRANWNGFVWKLFQNNVFILSAKDPLTIVKFVYHKQQRRP